MPEPKPVKLHDAALEEMVGAAAWYAESDPDVAEAFARELEHALETIGAAPERWPIEQAPTRRYLLKRFPFKLVYLVEETRCLVLAIAHTRRQRGYWRARLK